MIYWQSCVVYEHTEHIEPGQSDDEQTCQPTSRKSIITFRRCAGHGIASSQPQTAYLLTSLLIQLSAAISAPGPGHHSPTKYTPKVHVQKNTEHDLHKREVSKVTRVTCRRRFIRVKIRRATGDEKHRKTGQPDITYHRYAVSIKHRYLATSTSYNLIIGTVLTMLRPRPRTHTSYRSKVYVQHLENDTRQTKHLSNHG